MRGSVIGALAAAGAAGLLASGCAAQHPATTHVAAQAPQPPQSVVTVTAPTPTVTRTASASVLGFATTRAPATPATPAGPPHFATPQAAMRYLAAAYDAGDDVALAHVTTPAGRAELQSMRADAVNLRLVSCTAQAAGDYQCVFDHDFRSGHRPTDDAEGPAPDGSTGGWAQFTVGPATTPGWYMTELESCD